MDPRVREHAEIIVDHSVDVGPDDEVLLRGHPVAEDLMIAIAELCGERGANLSVRSSSSRVDRAYRKAIDAEDISQSAVSLAGAEATDVAIAVRADANTFETSDIDPEKTSVMATVNKEIQEEMMGKRWVGTQYPAPANAPGPDGRDSRPRRGGAHPLGRGDRHHDVRRGQPDTERLCREKPARR